MDLMTLEPSQVMLHEYLASLKKKGEALYAKKRKRRELRLEKLAREGDRLREALSPSVAACCTSPGAKKNRLSPALSPSRISERPKTAVSQLKSSVLRCAPNTDEMTDKRPKSAISRTRIPSARGTKGETNNIDKNVPVPIRRCSVDIRAHEKIKFNQSTNELRSMVNYLDERFFRAEESESEQEVPVDSVSKFLEKEDLSRMEEVAFSIIGWSSEHPSFPATNLQEKTVPPLNSALLTRASSQRWRASLHASHSFKVEATFSSMALRRLQKPNMAQSLNLSAMRAGIRENEVKMDDRWVSANLERSRQWLLFDLKQQCTIAAVDLTLLAGSDMTPKSCIFQYSRGTADGPWVDGFEFEISKKDPTANIIAQYEKYAKLFRALLVQQFGSMQKAWDKILDTSRDGQLSYLEFQKVAMKLGKKGDFEWKSDLQRLFQELDLNDNGEIGIAEMEAAPPRRPASRYWRLMMLDNWDSMAGMALLRPLRIHVYKNDDDEGFSQNTRVNFKPQIHGIVAEFHPTEEDIQVRQLAQSYGVHVLYIDSIAKAFRKFDEDNSGMLEYNEFRHLLLTVMKVPDPELLPESRSRVLWSYVEKENPDCVDFEEFIFWYMSMFQDVCLSSLPRHVESDKPKKSASMKNEEDYVSYYNPDTMLYQLLGSKRFVPIMRELESLESKNKLGVRMQSTMRKFDALSATGDNDSDDDVQEECTTSSDARYAKE